MSDVRDSGDSASRDQGWLFVSPQGESQAGSDGDGERPPASRRLGKGLLTLLDEAMDPPREDAEDAEDVESAVTVFGPGSVIQLSSCAEGELEYEPAPLPPPAPAAREPVPRPAPPPVEPEVIIEPEVVIEPEPVVAPQPVFVDEPAPDPGPAVLIDDEVFGLEMPDVELE